MNIKMLLLIVFSCLLVSTIDAQYVVKSDDYKISFVTPEILEAFETDLDSFLSYDSDNYTVGIAIVRIETESKKFLKDLKYGAKEIALDMGFVNIKDGGKGTTPEPSHYVTALTKDGLTPVYVFALLSWDRKLAYEMTVYCYNLDMTEGEKIIKSFMLNK